MEMSRIIYKSKEVIVQIQRIKTTAYLQIQSTLTHAEMDLEQQTAKIKDKPLKTTIFIKGSLIFFIEQKFKI